MAHLVNRMTFKSTLEGRERANVLQQWHDPCFSHPKHKPQQEYWEQSWTHKAATFFLHCQHSQRVSRFSLIHRSCVTQSFQFTSTRDAPPLPAAALPLPVLLATTTTTQTITSPLLSPRVAHASQTKELLLPLLTWTVWEWIGDCQAALVAGDQKKPRP